ncbi:lysophospholipid acyltransferase family protein [Costertonia aggregata]|uniref:1-acyl-sn-glycerol-3-phosphate acyltransferase n=1 Tax=Costertonia aggregata TaxID=343403 RepID=A0A7H9AS49_9FLAO|nr:lysophospholipid acyltransferase family protein [Costertonia aggregata]QLG46269.1 1-acyl-sn-glycerol-3-phosphate acyltransferase [Costertonia aggregata]
MSKISYAVLRLIIRCALRLYFTKIKINGLQNIPRDKPVLFVPNHQNALLDALLIVTHNRRKPYFLTRSDVFKSRALKRVFSFLRMLPIYRIRDGKDALANNHAIFDRCSELLKKNKTLVVFPEANHNLQRRVRPLSKGFVRILHTALVQEPNLDIQLIPIGFNYKDAKVFPDSVAVYYGKPISVQKEYDINSAFRSTARLKKMVSDDLQQLTTHIHAHDYEKTIAVLDALEPDYLDPTTTNRLLQDIELKKVALSTSQKRKINIGKPLFWVLNFPVLLLWKHVVLPKVPEDEFRSTFRFGYFLLFYPLYCTLLLIFFGLAFGYMIAAMFVLVLFMFNWGYVKFKY